MAVKRPILLLAGSLIAFTAHAQVLEHFSVGQVVPQSTVLTAYVDARNAGDTPVATLPQTALRGALDGKPLNLVRFAPIAQTGPATAYVLLVDTSGSESHGGFKQIQAALSGFIDKMGAQDQAAVMSFGDDVKVVAQFTGDKKALKAATDGLKDTAKTTQLNGGLEGALRLARREDAGLPMRRAIIVLSDGKDEGSGLTTEDVLHDLDEDRVPIYAVGASTLPGRDRATYLEVLHRFAVLSGGAFYEANPSTVKSVYDKVHDRLSSSWVADFECHDCATDGKPHLFQVELTENGATLADKVNVPARMAAPVTAQTQQSQQNQPAQHQSASHLKWIVAGAVAGILILIVLLIWIFARRKQTAVSANAAYVSPVGMQQPVAYQPGDLQQTVGMAPAEDSRPGLCIEFTRMDARSGGKPQYRGKLVERLLVGRGTEAGLRLEDKEISGRHCTLELVNGHIMLSDAGSTHGTALNGVPVNNRSRVESGDVISLGSVRFRVRIEPC